MREVTAGTVRPVGSESSNSRSSTVVRSVLCTSTMGLWPETITDSSRAPTLSSALTVAVKSDGKTMPSRIKLENPGKVKLTRYVPGRRAAIAYRPSTSVTAVRVFSMSAGLATSTVTPGSTPPLESVTTPVIWLWAEAAPGSKPPAKQTKTAACAT